MRLLIIGPEGFVGPPLVPRARAPGRGAVRGSHHSPSTDYPHRHIDRHSPDFRTLGRDVEPDAVILAAATGSVGKAQSQPQTAFHDTCGTLATLIAALREHRPHCRVLQMSSMAV